MKIYGFRLFKGLFYTGASTAIIYHEFGANSLTFGEKWLPQIEAWSATQSETIQTIVAIATIIALIGVMVYFVKGVFYLWTLKIDKHPAFEIPLSEMLVSSGIGLEDGADALQKMQSYRDSKMATMTNSDAAMEYKQTAWVDGLLSSNSTRTKAVRGYINGELSSRTNVDGYNWLKNRR
jgi:hypothetical protein